MKIIEIMEVVTEWILSQEKGMLKVCMREEKGWFWGRGFGFDKHSYAEVKILFGKEEQKGGIKYYDRFPVCVFRYN